jgi:glycosyltransferase involved in cell wall biosynthesis
VIAGDGPEKQSLMRLADSLSLTGHVKWLGWQENLQQFYLSLDVLLFNSDWDALGRTPLEAIGLGVPVVASVVNGGLSEILDSEDYAFVASNHDLDWLARKVEIFAKDPQTGRAAALRARDHLMRTSAPIEHAQQMIALLSL